uniref:Demethylmenaquinone methyltransferase putative n=1 Tax=Albugo laibachii Nc14 TaxID=890382 RepID=F0WCG6_9STRA|nr:demethylmenaquinone methyltransferase putative [Albugo laibachii Nc14]|eukprot:CCA18881.1 demethylmenaquinone methyltransferase putative [Albugo laibachii Nc14]
MGRKPSNVYDYFTRLEPIGGKGLARYECKKCKKKYASNATRLAEHLRQTDCCPNFQSNQRSPPSLNVASVTNDSNAVNSMNANLNLSSNATVNYGNHTNSHMLQGLRMLDSDITFDTNLLLRIAKLSTCAIADALAHINIQGHLVDVNLVHGYDNPLSVNICGPAFTVKVLPNKGPEVKKLPFHYIDTADMGYVIVISAPERSTTAVFGGLLATASKARGIAGVVTDGRVRDLQELCTMGFPAFSRGTSVHGSRNATSVVDVGQPIAVSGCVVRNGDIIRGDVNGVIVIPAEHANDVAVKAELIEEQDNGITDAVQQGDSLQRSFQRFRSQPL